MRAAYHFLAVAIISGGTLTSCAKKEKKEGDLAAVTTIVAWSQELPECTSDKISQVYWVEEQEKLLVCNGSKFVEIKGESGEKGQKGETGSAGPAGSAANSGVWLFDGNDKAIGVIVDATRNLVLFTNGGMTTINLLDGTYNYPFALSALGDLLDPLTIPTIRCYFAEASCAGTCYQVKVNIEKPLKGSVYRNASAYAIATGEEDLVPSVTFKSHMSNTGTCTNIADSTADGYPITRLYAFPDGITFPLAAPLSFGFKTED